MTISTFILAIALVESGNNPRAVGKAGELSEYQITRQVWEWHTAIPFTKTNAKQHGTASRVAERHTRYLEKHAELVLISQSDHDMVTRCAAGWHRGEAYMKRPVSRWSKETRDYTDRVWNTYEQLKREGK